MTVIAYLSDGTWIEEIRNTVTCGLAAGIYTAGIPTNVEREGRFLSASYLVDTVADAEVQQSLGSVRIITQAGTLPIRGGALTTVRANVAKPATVNPSDVVIIFTIIMSK